MVEEMASLCLTGFADPGWEHDVAQDERKEKVKCNYRGKIVSGGICRLKQHLARISDEVTYRKKFPEEVYMKMKENLEGCRASKKTRSRGCGQAFELHLNDDHEEDEEPVGYRCNGRQIGNDQVTAITPLQSLWEHGVARDEKKRNVKYKYCEKIVSGGINRFKRHLARIPGEVAYCKMAHEEVYLKMKENMKWIHIGRRRRPEAKELVVFYMHPDNDEEEGLPNRKDTAITLL